MRMSYYLKSPNTDPKYLTRIDQECAWIENKIKQVERTKLPKRPSAMAEIRDLQRQLRQRELELTFTGPEWSKYEKYGIWESLTA